VKLPVTAEAARRQPEGLLGSRPFSVMNQCIRQRLLYKTRLPEPIYLCGARPKRTLYRVRDPIGNRDHIVSESRVVWMREGYSFSFLSDGKRQSNGPVSKLKPAPSSLQLIWLYTTQALYAISTYSPCRPVR
jgi:hypothetical protein